MTTSKEEKFRNKIRKLFALMGSANEAEAAARKPEINELLGKNKKTGTICRSFSPQGTPRSARR